MIYRLHSFHQDLRIKNVDQSEVNYRILQQGLHRFHDILIMETKPEILTNTPIREPNGQKAQIILIYWGQIWDLNVKNNDRAVIVANILNNRIRLNGASGNPYLHLSELVQINVFLLQVP